MITAIGIFDRTELAEQAGSYLLANEFESEDINIHTKEPATDREDWLKHSSVTAG